MATAQEQLKALLREELAPRLRAEGLTGTERSFTVPSREFFAQLGIQSSVSSTSEIVKFTVNAQVIRKASWEAARQDRARLPAKPSPNARYSVEGSWDERVGLLMGTTDRWWTLGANGANRGEIASDVIHAVIDFALPSIRERMA
ncbi:DUF4304 domain-containing protein [Agromyces aureus]|uniref:DUF4304 domain-containing protein n=1 Tax=Agromyces aureus TaxID=453304 RepID=A0A191WGQ5_9MICO|nr:DUF4304 domain-containing protein [Agromyces aureus]ANJ27358.1 hypothetical protein ATC03_12145 [Agromyces aureus]